MKKNYFAFTLLELSIVLTIVALLLTLSFNSARYFLEQNHIRATRIRLETIKNALEIYLIQNNALPCPAGLALSTGESLSSCVASNVQKGLFVTNDIARGWVPYRELNLTPDVALDAWGDKITYSVSTDALSDFKSMIDGFSGINVFNNTSGSDAITTEGIYSINSHGKNKLGAYYKDGTVNSSTGISNSEGLNTPTSDNSDTFVYFTDYKTYDDIGEYKTRMQMAMDANIEDLDCYVTSSIITDVLKDSGIPSSVNFTDIPSDNLLEYEGSILSENEDYKIKCFKYGRLGVSSNE